MKEEKIALVKAINSGDTDLGKLNNTSVSWRTQCSPAHISAVYQVLLHLRSTLSPGDFFHVLDDSASPNLTPAVKLLQVYAREADRQLLRDFYYQDDRRTENACLEMAEAGSSSVSPASQFWCCHYTETGVQRTEDRIEHLQKAAKFFGEHKDRLFESKVSPSLVSH